MNILNSGRFSMGSAVAGLLKKVIGRYIRDRSPYGTALPLLLHSSLEAGHVLRAGWC